MNMRWFKLCLSSVCMGIGIKMMYVYALFSEFPFIHVNFFDGLAILLLGLLGFMEVIKE